MSKQIKNTPKTDMVNDTEKKSFDFKKNKNYIYTGIFLTIFFILLIVNNSDGDTLDGPYPPYYSKAEVIKLSDYKGKVVLLDFWATWCPPCRKGIPDLVELKNEFKNKGVEVIGISLDALTHGGQTQKDVVPFMKSNKINYPIVKGNDKVIMDFGGINSIPTSFVVDKEGYIIGSYVGLVEKSAYVNDINKALKGGYDKKSLKKAPNFSLEEIK
ncbi:MAG TPA: TlpA disulfide reductase family protein [Melioribacteraceae bacterium]|nr:TlpA disulfide reductase family protein [Melioribacteraceae bacterium]